MMGNKKGMSIGIAKSLGFANNSSLFSKRGDPWVTDKEGWKDYGRSPVVENPDFDRYSTTKAVDTHEAAAKALSKKELAAKAKTEEEKRIIQKQRIAAGICRAATAKRRKL